MSWISGTGLTAFGRLEGSNTLKLMSTAATSALAEAGMERKDIGGLICGYSTTFPHLMLSTVFAEHFGIRPSYAHSLQLGGGTGLAMVMVAHHLVDAGIADNILVVAGENRLTGQSRDASIQTLAQVGHPVYEVPLGATIPAYYALLASQYMDRFGVGVEDLAELAVLMRRQAQHHPGAQFRSPITVEDVLQSRQIASPLKILDCCPVSDGGAAFIITRMQTHPNSIRIVGCGQAHLHQHVSTIADISSVGGAISANRALEAAKRHVSDINYVAIYDSFTITLTMLLEEIGFASRGKAGSMARDGFFDRDGRLPLNTHGGLLSYGHCGVGGAMAHLVEACAQMTGRAESRQVRDASVALVHADGGVLSSHVSMVLEQS